MLAGRCVMGLLATTLAFFGTSGSATAEAAGVDRSVVLPDSVEGIAAIEIDARHIYVAGFGPSILVFEHDGDPAGSIPTPNEIADLAISSDGSVVWVSSWPSEDIVGYDTTTLVEVDRVTLAGGCPDKIATSLTYLVANDSCSADNIVVVDLEGDRAPFSPSGVVAWPLEIMMGPDMPSTAVVGSDLGELFVVDISEGAATVVGTLASLYSARDFALNTVTSEVAIASTKVPTQFPLYALPVPLDRGAFSVMTSGAIPVGVAFSGDGDWILTVSANGPNLEYLLNLPYFSASAADYPVWEYVLEGHEHYETGLVLNGDGTVMYSLTKSEAVNYLQIKQIDRRGVPGSISGTIRDVTGEAVEMGHADLLDLERTLLQSVDARSDGTYRFDNVQPGEYLVAFWNGDETTIWDYFPNYYADAPRLRSDLATRVVVNENQTTEGIDGTLPWLFFDMFGHVFEADIYWLGLGGVTRGCNPPSNTYFCANAPVTRGQMAAFINRAFDLEVGAPATFVDDDASIFEADIERLAAAGITRGCNPPVNDRFCPNDPVTRGQMAAFLTRVFELTDRGTADFADDDGSVFEADIERLATAGITKGCNPPVNDRFCPNELVTRGQMAAFFHRGYVNIIYAAADTVAGDAVAIGGTDRLPKSPSIDDHQDIVSSVGNR